MEENVEVSFDDQQESKSLCLLYSLTDLYESVCDLRLLKSIILVGHTIDSLTGIEKLCNLEELWIVDANLHQEDIEPLERCTGLNKLYLYDNKLQTIPDFSSLNKLACLWLCNNQISSISNTDTMPSLRDLNLGGNEIKEINISKASTTLEMLNLSGNPLHDLTDLAKFVNFKQLRSLIIADPLFRTSPVSLLANFRQYVIFVLPRLATLDFKDITETERKLSVEFFHQKMQYYRLKLRKCLAKQFVTYQEECVTSSEKHDLIWRALYIHGPKECIDPERNSNFIFWEREALLWRKFIEYNIAKQRQLEEIMTKTIQLELEYSGNIAFNELDPCENSGFEEIKKIMDSYVCTHLKKVVEEIDLLNAWSISGTFRTILQQLTLGNMDENLFIWKPVQELCNIPLDAVKEYIFERSKGIVEVSKCLGNTDPLVSCTAVVHDQLLSLSPTVYRSRLIILCGILNSDHLTQEATNPQICPECQLMVLTESSSMVPLYLVHFKYKFVDYFKPLRSSIPTVDLEGKILLPNMIKQQTTNNITTLVLNKANIKSLDVPPMQSVTSLDLSYNLLESLSSISLAFPRVTYLNLSFNRIKRVLNVQRFHDLNNLILKWNFISECVRTFTSLKDVQTLKRLNVDNNPFRDVSSKEHELYFVCLNLKNLHAYNDAPLPWFLTSGKVVLQAGGRFPTVPLWNSSNQALTTLCKSDLVNDNEGNVLGTFNQRLVSIRLRGLNLSSFMSDWSLVKLKWLNLSSNLISDLSVLKGLSRLVEVDLSRNVVESVSTHDDVFKYLTRLNLSHNCIMSLAHLKSQSFPHIKILDLSHNNINSLLGIAQLKTLVELYITHNSLKDRDTLIHCKSLKKLKVLDFSFNPMALIDNIREHCLYYLGTLNYLNGSKVEAEELKNAMVLFGGFLDIDYLLRTFSKPRLINLTNLSLPNCSIKKIQLPANSLVNVISVCLDNNKISSLDWIQFLPRAQRISLSNNCICSHSTSDNTSCVDSQQNNALCGLILDHNQIRNLVPLQLDLFPNLKLLVLNNNSISFLSGINKNNNLEKLILDRNKLTSIHPDHARNLKNLLELHVEHNSLTKLDFLKSLRKVQRLYLGYNKILARSSLGFLAELPELKELTLHGNPLMRQSNAYKEYLPFIPSLQLLEGHDVTEKYLLNLQ